MEVIITTERLVGDELVELELDFDLIETEAILALTLEVPDVVEELDVLEECIDLVVGNAYDELDVCDMNVLEWFVRFLVPVFVFSPAGSVAPANGKPRDPCIMLEANFRQRLSRGAGFGSGTGAPVDVCPWLNVETYPIVVYTPTICASSDSHDSNVPRFKGFVGILKLHPSSS